MGYTQGYMELGMGNIYPAMGESVGNVATNPDKPIDAHPQSHATVPDNIFSANPLVGGAVLIGFVLAIMLIVHHFGRESGEFSNLKASFYNVFLVALIAVAGIPAIKAATVALAGWHIPFFDHVASYTLSA